jgi:N-succinyldiaminopimelate aminotransferase
VIASRLSGFGTTIFTEMSALAERTGAINLGQGFPDEDGPEEVLEAAQAAIRAGRNQYAPLPGVAALRQAIAEHQRRFYGLELDPASEVQVTMGATEAITAAVLGLCEPGDEVIAFDPTYDSYSAAAMMTGARLVPVALRAPDWTFDPAELQAAITPRTRAILVNSPHNPTGRVLSRAELETIATLVQEHALIAITRAPPHPAGHAAGDGGAHADDLLAGQDVQRHRLEGRLGDGAGAARGRRPRRQAVHDLRRRDAVPARGRGGAAVGRRVV